MVSVTSEASANLAFQGATARSGRSDSDRSAGNDGFAALVDSNTSASNSDNRAPDAANAPRRADDQQTPPDNRARDNTAASDKAATDKAARNDVRNDSCDREAATNGRDKADAEPNTDASHRAKSKSASPKSDASKSDETRESKPASGDSAVSDPTGAKADGTAEITANAVATVIPVATAEIVTATPASDKAAAPLAIAAAAIATTAALAGAAAGPAGTDTSATPAATANAAKTEGSKIDVHAAASAAVTAQTTDATVTSSIALAASAATTPGASKAATQAKTPVVAKEGAVTPGDSNGTAGTTATAAPAPGTIVAAVTPQAEVAAQPKAETGIVDAAKPEIAGKSASANAQATPADASQTLANAPNNNLPAAGAIQTQQPAASAPAPQLNVTAATTAAVPLSGLAMEITASANSGKSRFEIRLDPAELGRIDVRIDIDRHGQVTSHLTVERPETLSMLRQDATQLQRALDNAGLSTGSGGLQFSLRDQSSQGRNDGNQFNPNAHRLIVSEEDSVPATVVGRSYGRMPGWSGGVDIRI